MITEESLWKQVTHLHCHNCNTRTEVDFLGFDLESQDDLDDAYDEVECCDDPILEAEIHSDEPLFDNDEVNDDFVIKANPRLGIESNRYEYTVDEDLLNRLNNREVE